MIFAAFFTKLYQSKTNESTATLTGNKKDLNRQQKATLDQFPCQNDADDQQKNAPPAPKTRKRPKKPKKLDAPAPLPRRGTKEFKALCELWNKKLADSGFKDIERPDPRVGYATPDSWLNGKSLRSIADSWDSERELYYRRLTHYITHNGHQWHNDAFYRFAARLYIEGVPYSGIVARARAKAIKPNANKWHVHQMKKQLEAKAFAWNKSSPLGVDYVSDFEGEGGAKGAKGGDAN